MKIGILTHHYVKNYGAFLQMKGMYETLQRLYPEAEVTVINYVNQKHWRRNILHILHFRPGIDTLSTYVEKIRQLRTFTKYERSIPRTRSVKTAKEIIDLKLDLIVLGSDEIWNLCGSGYHPLKFGTGLENQRTIAYAPSVGAVTEETAVPEDVFSGLKHLDRISGRDVESLKFVERACGRKAEKMLDPTFLYNFDTDIERENIKPKPYRYILIYDCKLTEPMVKQLQEYAKKNDADLILVCDPDADRMGVGVKHNGEYVVLTGNQSGSVEIEYICSQLTKQNKMPENPVMFNTVVTSDLGEKVAADYGVTTEKTLTGFKFIGEKVAKYEVTHEKNYVFGYEESYGSLIKPFVRDKDAPQACLMLAEACAYYKQEGKDLVDVLDSLYDRHGTYEESQVALTLSGEAGANRIKEILANLRKDLQLKLVERKLLRAKIIKNV